MRAILGIDQGSSHTRAVICDLTGRLLGYGAGFGACHAYDGMQRAMQAVREAAEAATVAAVSTTTASTKGDALQIDLLYSSMTGADWPEEYTLLQNNLRELNLAPITYVSNDSIAALRGGTEQSYGCIIIAGTGGNCAVRSTEGQEYIYAYYHDADLQGGTALSRQALQAVFRSHTGRGTTLLTGLLLEHFGLQNVDDLGRAYFSGRLPEIHHCAPRVFTAARLGDAVALEILRQFGAGCAALALNALARFQMTDLPVEVVLSGSIFKGESAALIDALAGQLRLGAPHARLINARYEPVVGAALLGLESLGVPNTPGLRENIEQSASRLGLLREPAPVFLP